MTLRRKAREPRPQPGIGPAIAVIEAVRSADLYQLRSVGATLGLQTVADSIAELLHRELHKEAVAGDTEFLDELYDVTTERWAYQPLALTRADQVFPFTWSQRWARTLAAWLCNHYATCALTGDDSKPLRLDVVSEPRLPDSSLRGLAYMATLVMHELSEDHHELDNKLDRYRAQAAAETLHSN